MRNVVIIGNSGAARECYWLLQDVSREQKDLAFKGFLSFEGHKGALHGLSTLEMGSDDDYAPDADDVFVIGIGIPNLRLKVFQKWKERGARFINLVHPTVERLGPGEMGEGNILASHCSISCDTILGDANFLNGSVVLGHDARIGHGNCFSPFSLVLGDACIGSGNSFGVHSVVMPGAKIGDNNTIVPGAYIYKGCRDNTIMAGNPALCIRG